MAASWTGTTGVLIGGRYRLRAPVAKGAMGEIWRADHLSLRVPVAIKLIDPELVRTLSGTPEQLEILGRFEREARATALIRHPNVAHVYDNGVDNGVPYMVMELLEGETLATRLTRGPLAYADTVRIIHQVARVLARAHELGIVHRDLKPENVFLVQGDEEMVKVLDFGVAKLEEGGHAMAGQSIDSLAQTLAGNMVGTPCYMSPEQVEGRTVDWRSDLWALAVISYECVCGRRPFDAPAMGALALDICVEPLPVPSQHAQVPLGFDQWWARAASRDPANRFQNARELSNMLRMVLAPTFVFDQTNPVMNIPPALRSKGIGTDTADASALEVPVPPRSSASLRWAIAFGVVAMVAGGAMIAVRSVRRPVVVPASAASVEALSSALTPSSPADLAPPPTAEPSSVPLGGGPAHVDAAPAQPAPTVRHGPAPRQSAHRSGGTQ